MTELDPQLRGLLSRTKAELSPPGGTEARMLADFHGRLQAPPSEPAGHGGSGEGGLGTPVDPGPGGLGLGAKAQLVYGLKVTGAVLGLTAIGLGGLWTVGQMTQGPGGDEPAIISGEREREPSPLAGTSAPEPAPTLAPADTDAVETRDSAEPTPRPTPRSRDTGSPSKPGAEPPSAATLAAELRLIQAARAAPPARALELLGDHREQFPDGELRLEREALIAVALCELGRGDQARDQRELLAALELSPLLRDKVEAACGPKK